MGFGDLEFRDGENGFNVQTSAFTAMRLLQAVRVAASLVRGGNQGEPGGPGGPVEGALEVLCDRRQLKKCLRGHSWNPEAEVGVPRE